MATSHIDDLRSSFPSHFVDRDPVALSDELLRIPTEEPDQKTSQRRGDELDDDEPIFTREEKIEEREDSVEDALAQMPPDKGWEPVNDNLVGVFGGHPGGLTGDSSGPSSVFERLAFYLPFHMFPDWWGIYIFPEGIQRVRCELADVFLDHGIPPREQVRVAKRLLYHHEFYHHATESFATRLEAILNQPCYLNGFSPLYKATFGTAGCLEETCANSYAREKTIAKSVSPSIPKGQLRDAIDLWFRGAPPGYAEAEGSGSVWSKDLRASFYEKCLNSCLPLAGVPARSLGSAGVSAWSAAGYFDRGIGDVRSRIFYIIPKGSPFHSRLPADVRTCIKGRSFKQKLQTLNIARFQKQGGSHELWVPSSGGRPVPIPRHDGVDIPKGTMRGILRQLGARMSIEQFLAA